MPRWLILASVIGAFVASFTVTEVQSASSDSQIATRAYPVADLPIWKVQDGTEPTANGNILMRLIRVSLGNKAAEDTDAFRMEFYEPRASLIITTTQTTHDEIVELRTDWRKDSIGE